ncbi:MAG: major facilitator superfamily domain-containing protein [Monoraphidium minutum]|nr:MAG: major facilitator superfamily domain-containing protein [Monoraphidium minutum]
MATARSGAGTRKRQSASCAGVPLPSLQCLDDGGAAHVITATSAAVLRSSTSGRAGSFGGSHQYSSSGGGACADAAGAGSLGGFSGRSPGGSGAGGGAGVGPGSGFFGVDDGGLCSSGRDQGADPAAPAAAGAQRAQAAAGASASGQAGGAALGGEGPAIIEERSIYSSWSERRRHFILLLMSLSTFLVPFSETVYLPALSIIERELNTTATLMAATVGVYMFTVGATALLWGPFCDRYGRRNTLLLSSSTFVGFSLGCTFAPSIQMLIAFRALQGSAVSALMVAATAVLSDSWEPAQRGRAMGIFTIPTLIGPIVGPLLGGGLAQSLGWRSTFVAMAVCGALVFVALLAFMEETHHHHILKKLQTKEGPMAVLAIREHSVIQQPKFRAPWKPLKYIVEPTIFPHVMVTFLLYATMLSGLIILPDSLAAPPYSLKEALIGVANLPLGVGCFLIGPFGGHWADAAARRWPQSHTGRMLPGLVAAGVAFPLSTLAYAWSLQFRTHLAGPLVSAFFMGASICATFPGVMSYISIVKQHAAAAAGGAVQAVMFICGGVFIQITPMATAVMGLGPWVSLLVTFCFLSTCASTFLVVRELKAGANEKLPVMSAAESAAAAAAAAAASLGDNMVEATLVPRGSLGMDGKGGEGGKGGAAAGAAKV